MARSFEGMPRLHAALPAAFLITAFLITACGRLDEVDIKRT